MKNINIPPYASFIAGIILIVVARILFLNPAESIIPLSIQALGFIITILGLAGLIGKLFRKKIINK